MTDATNKNSTDTKRERAESEAVLQALGRKPQRKTNPWIQTHTNKVFHLLGCTPDEICIEDIAHALSHICRFGGHTSRFYSVAEHCVVMSRVIPTLECLLHDASEAYLGDMVRPLKMNNEMYRDVEADVEVMIARKFSLPVRLDATIKQVDMRMLVTERNQLMGKSPLPYDVDEVGYQPFPFTLECLPPPLAKQQFLQRYKELMSE